MPVDRAELARLEKSATTLSDMHSMECPALEFDGDPDTCNCGMRQTHKTLAVALAHAERLLKGEA